MAFALNKLLPDLSKLEPLDGKNYRRWSQKMLIFFEQLKVDYVLFEDTPTDFVEDVNTTDDSTAATADAAATKAVAAPEKSKRTASKDKAKGDDQAKRKYEKDNKTVRGHLLSHMTNPLFDLFIPNKSAKSIWETLQKKYGADDAGKRKYVTGEWLRFQVVDDKSIMDQVHEYENLVFDVLAEGMTMCEILQANVLIEKLPQSWAEYCKKLRHKKRDMPLDELVYHIKIEEANRLKDKSLSYSVLPPVKANLIESSNGNNHRSKGNSSGSFKSNKKSFKKPGNKHFKNHGGQIQKKNNGACFVCGKTGHKANRCFKRFDKNKDGNVHHNPQANVVEHDDIITAVVSEVNMIYVPQ
ncbi:unnamed protein product [Cuscuta campestris]|uniref:CCHC-type domain-containing protein n=1 Tax=Cuscuta campestris TaxID=132261 RepID=A0A484L0Q5_9ASTE|nr:unnamed protein product [Cuscuta campestris]